MLSMAPVTSSPRARCPGHCSHDKAWRPLSAPAAAQASGDQAAMSPAVILLSSSGPSPSPIPCPKRPLSQIKVPPKKNKKGFGLWADTKIT